MAALAQSPGETNLLSLPKTMRPTLLPETFVFLTLPFTTIPPPSLDLLMTFREPSRGLTIITTRDSAEQHSLEYIFPSKMIKLDVHSSLEAVGFMAVVARKLAQNNIACNPVSGFYHDYCFVGEGSEEVAMEILRDLVENSKEGETSI